MKVVYIADDGKEFDNEFDCEVHEWKLRHPHLQDVRFYDECGNELIDIFSEGSYNKTEKVVIPNDDALKDFQDFAECTGFYCYDSVVDCGEWTFDYDTAEFVKA